MAIEIICPHCQFSKAVPEDKIPAAARWAKCPQCKNRITLPVRGAAPDTEIPPLSERPTGRGPCAWEKRAERGSWQAIYESVKGVLFSPTDFFGKMTFQGGVKDPLLFGIMIGSVGTMFGFFWNFLMMWGSIRSLGEGRVDPSLMGALFILLMVCSPLLVFITILFTSSLMHLLLLITGGGRHGFEATLRAVSYAQATQVWGMIPFVGGLLGNLWLLVVQIIGLREIHDTSYWRIVVALMIPFVLILLAGIALLIILLSS